MSSPLVYPAAKRVDVTDTFHGVQVADPYRWLEKSPEEDADVEAWIAAQESLTTSYMAEHCDAATKTLESKLTAVYNYAKYSVPFQRAGKYYFFKNDGLQNQSVLYALESLDDTSPRVLLDPNTLREDGTASLNTYAFSECGTYLAYGISESGSDWVRIHVRRTATCDDTDDVLEDVKFSSIAWTHDHAGFFYSRYPTPAVGDGEDARGTETDANENQRLFYHTLGTPQSDDVCVFAAPEHPQWMFGASVSDDGAWLVVTVSESCENKNQLHYAPLVAGQPVPTREQFTALVPTFDAEYSYVCNDGADFLFKSNKDAPRGKVVAVQLPADAPGADVSARVAWSDRVPQSEHVLETVAAVGRFLIVTYMEHVKETLHLHTIADGARHSSIPLPTLGSVAELSARREQTDWFFKFQSFTHPGTIFRCALGDAGAEVSLFRETTIAGYSPDAFATEQVFVESKDGTRVPIFIVAPRDHTPSADTPVLLYGYGGFNISLTPYFSVVRLAWLMHVGGVFVLANLRGGGEYGEDWHHAGTKTAKQNVFDDFCAVASHLHTHGHTSPDKLAIMGGSNGGLLVAACANQHPELFGAAVAQVGVMDMLRFHKFTIGYAWTSDYGSVDDADEFAALHAYSPVHNVPAAPVARFPSLLLTTADHDDRVVPGPHSFKYAAAVQHALGATAERPLLIRIERKAGHGAGKPTSKVIAEYAQVFSFLAHELGVQVVVEE